MKVLYIGANWPQPWITAAGFRTVDLLRCFKSLGCEVDFRSIKKPNSYQIKAVQSLDIPYGYLEINREKDFIKSVDSPDLCVFETSRIEEMFGHYLFNHFPDCKRIIDTQDLHFLRLHRKKALEEGKTLKEIKNIELDWKNEFLCREFAGILRSHLTIVTSQFEKDLILKYFPNTSVAVLPFFYESEKIEKHKTKYSENNESRKNFVWIGNFQHEPNVDALRFMVDTIWPKIFLETGGEFHIYGSNYIRADEFQGLGIVPKGSMQKLSELSKYRCLLAYIRFGAGIKGKILDSFFHGLPVLTTSIGAEGISPFPGFIEDDPAKFISAAINTYSNKVLFKFQNDAFKIMEEQFSMKTNLEVLRESINSIEDHPIQNVMFGETIRSSYYFSKFIESKERKL